MRKLLLLIVGLFSCFSLCAQNLTTQQYKQDFDYFWRTIDDNYCYWDKKQTDWNEVRKIYGPLVDTVTSKTGFISILEKTFYELYDHHASLNSNTAESQRLVPSGCDLWAEYINGKPTITEVHLNSGADKVGMWPGMEIVMVNDMPVETAMQDFLPKCMKGADGEAKNYALRELLAGKHSVKRKITASYQNQKKDFFPDQPINLLETNNYETAIESKILQGNIGYIVIKNALGNNKLIHVFDSVLTTLMNTKAMILDLRETPSGGNTTVARSRLGRFVTREAFYQKHELTSEEKQFGGKQSWVEIVSPKKPPYKNLLIVLVDHWTGSVGEGIAIGFDALKRGTTIGTRMAGLNGAIYSFAMPNSGIGFSFPAEKLFHVNGTPRENFKPVVEVDLSKRKHNEDYILQQGLKYISDPLVQKSRQ